MLTRVTITGADDDVDPEALLALSREFPFVEWGILYSAKRVGTPRYPTTEWMARLPPVPKAFHLCGQSARDRGHGDWPRPRCAWASARPSSGSGLPWPAGRRRRR